MSDELKLQFNVTEYAVAYTVDEVNDLLKQGYEPYGEPDLVDFRQAMVYREPLTVSKYIDVMRTALLAMMKLQSTEMEDLFTADELADLEKDSG